MCFMRAPSIPEPVRYQQSQDPVYRDGATTPSQGRGRRGTILASTPSSPMARSTGTGLSSMMSDTAVTPKRTILGA
jgi:hypothetical protein